MKTDMLGQTIQVGDILAYPGRVSSDLWVNIGVVLNIYKHKVAACGGINPGHLQNYDRAIRIKPSMIQDKDILQELQEIFDNPKYAKYLDGSGD